MIEGSFLPTFAPDRLTSACCAPPDWVMLYVSPMGPVDLFTSGCLAGGSGFAFSALVFLAGYYFFSGGGAGFLGFRGPPPKRRSSSPFSVVPFLRAASKPK